MIKLPNVSVITKYFSSTSTQFQVAVEVDEKTSLEVRS
jgi:hypothetical protein